MSEYYKELPDRVDDAFLAIEREARNHYDEVFANLDDFGSASSAQYEYMVKVQAAARHAEIDTLMKIDIPSPTREDTYNFYNLFRADVEAAIIDIRFARIKGADQFSVELDAKAKSDIHDHIGKIRQVIEQADLDQNKKNALFDRLTALAAEVDRNRTRFGAFTSNALVLAVVADKYISLMRFISPMLERLGKAKSDEETHGLPPPKRRAILEPPKAEPSAQRATADTDDEIPF